MRLNTSAGVLSRVANSPPSQSIFNRSTFSTAWLTQGNSGNGAQRLLAWGIRRDHTLALGRSINIHHRVPAICNRLVHRLDPAFVAVVGNVLEEQCPIPWRGLANDHPACVEAFCRVLGSFVTPRP